MSSNNWRDGGNVLSELDAAWIGQCSVVTADNGGCISLIQCMCMIVLLHC